MVGTNEAFVHKIHSQQEEDELTEADKAYLGKAVRLEIPITSTYTIRRVASLFHSYADRLGVIARRDDKARVILLEASMELHALNRDIREAHGLAKFNRNGTTK